MLGPRFRIGGLRIDLFRGRDGYRRESGGSDEIIHTMNGMK